MQKVFLVLALLIGLATPGFTQVRRATVRTDSIQDSPTPGLCLRSNGGTGPGWQNCLAAGGGAAPGTTRYIIQIPDAGVPNAEVLSALGSGVVHNTTGTGVLTVSAVNLGSEVTGTLALTNIANGTSGWPLLGGASNPAYGKLGLAAVVDSGSSGQCLQSSGGSGLVFGACGTGGGGGAVSSVFGRINAVVAQTGDYSASQVTNAFDITQPNTVNSSGTQTFIDPIVIRPDGSNGVQVDAGGILRKFGAGLIEADTTVSFASTPTLCGTGNYARGVDVNGNATGCTAAASGAGYNLIQYQGSSFTQRTTLNFTGNALSITDNAGLGGFTTVALTQTPSASTSVVGSGRLISTTAPLSGGGDLNSDRTLAITADGIGPAQIDETAAYAFSNRLIASVVGNMTCGAGTAGKMGVDATTLQYCDNAGTPASHRVASGDAAGNALVANDLVCSSPPCVSDTEQAAQSLAGDIGGNTGATVYSGFLPLAKLTDNNTTANLPLLSGGPSSDPNYALLPIGSISATGSPSGSNFLRGDGSWATPSGTGYSIINEEGATVNPQRSILNFIGGAITAADDGVSKTNVTLSQSPNSASVVGTGRVITATSPLLVNGGASSTLAVDQSFSILADGINATQIDETANYNFTGELIARLGGAITCGAGTAGKIGTDSTTVQFCDNAGTPVAHYLALGNSSGVALSALTSSALAADGTNCAAGQAPLGVDAAGNVQSCTPYAQITGGASVDGEMARWSGTGGATIQKANYNAACTANIRPYDCCTGAGTGTCNIKSDTNGTFFAISLDTPRKNVADFAGTGTAGAGSCDIFKTQAGTTNTIALCAPNTLTPASATITFTANGNFPAADVENVGTTNKCAKFNSSGILVPSDVDCATTATAFSVAGDTGTNAINYGSTLSIIGGTNGIDTAESAGTVTLNLDTTEIGTTTFGSGAASYAWTVDTTGTDVVLTFSSGLLAVTGGVSTTGADGNRQAIFTDNTSLPSAPTAGNTSLSSLDGGLWIVPAARDSRFIAGTIHSIIADISVNTTATLTALATKTLVGSPPTNRIYHITTGGNVKTAGAGSKTMDYSVKIGNTTICDTGAFTPSNTTTAMTYRTTWEITVRNNSGVANTSTVYCNGQLTLSDTTTVVKQVDNLSTTVDLTGTVGLQTQIQFGSSDANNAIVERSAYFETVR